MPGCVLEWLRVGKRAHFGETMCFEPVREFWPENIVTAAESDLR
jgi:hypothetical protein